MMTLALATSTASGASANYGTVLFGETIAMGYNNLVTIISGKIKIAHAGYLAGLTQGLFKNTIGWIANNAAMLAGIAGIALIIYGITSLSGPMNALIGVLILGAAAWMAFNGSMTMGLGIATAVGGIMLGIGALKMMFPKQAGSVGGVTASGFEAGSEPMSLKQRRSTMDTGGRFNPTYYDGGGLTQEHGMAVLQKGETVISRSQNMAGGSEAFDSGGASIVIQGDIYDADKFIEKVSAVLPGALRRANDIGGI
jgi:hypothetical protein